jgi:hypothetical protein
MTLKDYQNHKLRIGGMLLCSHTYNGFSTKDIEVFEHAFFVKLLKFQAGRGASTFNWGRFAPWTLTPLVFIFLATHDVRFVAGVNITTKRILSLVGKRCNFIVCFERMDGGNGSVKVFKSFFG